MSPARPGLMPPLHVPTPTVVSVEASTAVARSLLPAVAMRARVPLLASLLGARLAPALPAIAFGAAGAVLAHYQPPAAAPETAYLALLGAWALAGAALLAPPRSRLPLVWPLLATVALWSIPGGPPRGIVVGTLLVAAVTVAGHERLRLGDLDAAAAAGGALAVHALLRAGNLLPARLGLVPGAAPGNLALTALARGLVPPLLAATALAILARRHAPRTVVGAGMAVALAGGGLTVTATLPLLALAAVELTRDRPARADAEAAAAAGDRRPAGAPSAGGRGLWRPHLAALAGVVVIALTALRPPAGALALGAAGARRLPPRWGWVAAALPLAWGLGTAEPGRMLGVAALLALLPFAPGAVRATPLLQGLILGAGGALLLPAPAGLAAAAALVALALPAGTTGAALQRGWLGLLLAGGALLAAYPWLRPAPLDAALALLGLPAVTAGRGSPLTVAMLLAAAAALALVARRASARVGAASLATLLAVALALALPPPARDALPPSGATLTAATPAWSGPVRSPVGGVRVVSSLAEAAALPAGTAVAILALERDDKPLAAWTLRAGTDTAEWAAERSDVRGIAAAGPVWWSWLPPLGTWFGHNYASSWRLSRPVPATSVRVALAPGLPPEVTLVLAQVEVSR